MKKTSKYRVVFSILLLLIAYLIGNFVPVKVFIPNINWSKQISSGELYYYFINTLQMFATLAAVIVALFGDKIKNRLWKPNLKFNVYHPNINEQLKVCKEPTKIAQRYFNGIIITNDGKAIAEDCQLRIEAISFKGIGVHNPINIFNGEKILTWNGSEVFTNAFISPHGDKMIDLFEILPPNEGSTPDGKDSTSVPKLRISDIDIPDEYKGGQWIINLCLNSRTITPQKIEVKIDWDGAWEHRVMEMKNHVNTDIKLTNSIL